MHCRTPERLVRRAAGDGCGLKYLARRRKGAETKQRRREAQWEHRATLFLPLRLCAFASLRLCVCVSASLRLCASFFLSSFFASLYLPHRNDSIIDAEPEKRGKDMGKLRAAIGLLLNGGAALPSLETIR
jgi:hypothetical protein